MLFAFERLNCGAGLAVAEMPHVESVSVGLWLSVGGRHEATRLNGISHFLEHMLFKGTAKRNARAISESVEGLGGYLNAFTAEELTCYFAKASSKHLPVLLDVLVDMLLNSVFPENEVQRERGVICEEIRMYDDQPGQVSQERLNALMWPNHPLGRSLSGTLRTVPRIKTEDLINHRRRFYHGGNLWITVAGKTVLPEVKHYLRPFLKRIPTGAPATFAPAAPSRQLKPRVEVMHKQIEQSHFALGLRGVSRHDPRRFAVRLLSVMLGENMSSRLFQVIRERHGLAYSINSAASYLADTGSLVITAGVDNEKLTKALTLTLRTLEAFARKAPSARELQRAKIYTLGQIHLSLESTTNQMMWLGENALGHGRVPEPAKVFRQIENVSAEDIRAAAQFLVSNRRLSLSVVSPTAQQAEMEELTLFRS